MKKMGLRMILAIRILLPMSEAQLKKWSRTKKEALMSGDVEELRRLAKRRAG